MTEAIISGLLLGGVLAFMVGPVFFLIINTSVKKGFLPAAMLAVGVLISDAMFVTLTWYGSSLIFYMKAYDRAIGFTGGLLILAFGIFTYLKQPRVHADALEIPDDSKTRIIDIIKGYTMNTLNPSVLLFWIGVAGMITVNEHLSGRYSWLFYCCTLGMVFSTDLLKAWAASRLKGIITGTTLLWMNRVAGIALGCFGSYMIIKFLVVPF